MTAPAEIRRVAGPTESRRPAICRTGQTPISALHFKRILNIRSRQLFLNDRHAPFTRRAHHRRTRRTCHAAPIHPRRHQLLAPNEKQIRHRPTHHATVGVTHQPFRNPRIRPLAARQHLLQAIEMLDPREQRLLRQRRLTPPHRHTRLSPLSGIRWPFVQTDDPRRLGSFSGSISPASDTPRHHEREDFPILRPRD